jgi:hypothetical protein
LRLSGIAATLSTRVMQAQSTQEPFLETFAAMLQDELDRRRSRLTERRFKQSRLDERPTLADFDWRFNPKLPRQACFELHTLKFIGEGANALIIGKPGTGKSHVAKAVAYQATLQGFDVRYVEADTEFAGTRWAAPPSRPSCCAASSSPTWSCWTTCSWPGASPRPAPSFCRPSSTNATSSAAAIVVTSNRVVQDWGKYLGDATMATTILDRLMHRAPCSSSRARATASRRPPHASLPSR